MGDDRIGRGSTQRRTAWRRADEASGVVAATIGTAARGVRFALFSSERVSTHTSLGKVAAQIVAAGITVGVCICKY